jgi:hypothetical protein
MMGKWCQGRRVEDLDSERISGQAFAAGRGETKTLERPKVRVPGKASGGTKYQLLPNNHEEDTDDRITSSHPRPHHFIPSPIRRSGV